MIIPVRCFSCGKPIAHLWESYKKRVEKGEKPDAVMDDLGIERYCCRRMFISQVDYMQEIAKYKK